MEERAIKIKVMMYDDRLWLGRLMSLRIVETLNQGHGDYIFVIQGEPKTIER